MLNHLKRILLKNNKFLFKRFDSGKAIEHIYDDNNPREISQLTRLDIINRDSDKTYFKAYFEDGFTINNFKICGACVAFPKTFFFWNIFNVEDVTEDSLELATILEPKLDIIIIGKGPRDAKPNIKMLLELSRKLKINFEILPTVEALSTFNFLNYEDRNVAAFILPVKTFSFGEEDMKEIMQLRNRRFTLFNEEMSDLLLDVDNKVIDDSGIIPKSLISNFGPKDKVGAAVKEIVKELENPAKINLDKKDQKKLE